MEVNTKKRRYGKSVKNEFSNSYGSTNCIRFEGIISARTWGHPFVFTATKVKEKWK